MWIKPPRSRFNVCNALHRTFFSSENSLHDEVTLLILLTHVGAFYLGVFAVRCASEHKHIQRLTICFCLLARTILLIKGSWILVFRLVALIWSRTSHDASYSQAYLPVLPRAKLEHAPRRFKFVESTSESFFKGPIWSSFAIDNIKFAKSTMCASPEFLGSSNEDRF